MQDFDLQFYWGKIGGVSIHNSVTSELRH